MRASRGNAPCSWQISSGYAAETLRLEDRPICFDLQRPTASPSAPNRLIVPPTPYSPVRDQTGMVCRAVSCIIVFVSPQDLTPISIYDPKSKPAPWSRRFMRRPMPVIPATLAEVALWLCGGAGESARVEKGTTG